jgi:hypothetical protein
MFGLQSSEADKTAIMQVTTEVRSTHQPDCEKADMLEATARGYEVLWKGTGAKHYEDKMKACFADANDYRTCGFVRPFGATF